MIKVPPGQLLTANTRVLDWDSLIDDFVLDFRHFPRLTHQTAQNSQIARIPRPASRSGRCDLLLTDALTDPPDAAQGSKADVEDHLDDDELRRDPVMQVLAGKLAARRSA